MKSLNKIKLAVLPGDGIGKEVLLSAIPVFEALNIPIEMTIGDIGWEFWKQEGAPIPDRTWELIHSSNAILLGAITSKPEREAHNELIPNLRKSNLKYVSPVIQLRQKLDLYANVRPCFDTKGEIDDFNFCLIRENTEGLYSGFDFHPLPDELKLLIDEKPYWKRCSKQEISCSLRLQSKIGLNRLFNFAFNYADSEKMTRVTLADKPNVLRQSGVFSREIFEKVAEKYPHIQADILNVDAVALSLIRHPERFGVIVAENMFGDILSDIGAGVMGGLGFAPSANRGEKGCYFEPVHGSAPKIQENKANPCAMFLTISLLLKNFSYHHQANLIKEAIKRVIKKGRYLTYDLGGNTSTDDMSKAIIDQCVNPTYKKTISFLATGNEIIEGEIQDTNSFHFSKIISNCGGEIYQHAQISDNRGDIVSILKYLLNRSDAVIITGGLGPTSDDNTRYAISETIRKPLYFNDKAWQNVVSRLKKFNLSITESNRQQALFPENAILYPNENGTAYGCYLQWNGKHIFMLPGPPKECLPLFEKYVLPSLEKSNFFGAKKIYRWLTLGLIEGEIAPKIDSLTRSSQVNTAYRWTYPYLEIKLITDNLFNDEKLIESLDKTLKPNTVSKDGFNAYEILNKNLPFFKDKMYVSGCDFVEQFVNELDHPNLLFMKGSSQSKFYMLNVIVDGFSVNSYFNTIHFHTSGHTDNKLTYEHRMTTPNRGADVIFYIKSYIAWQLIQFSKSLGWFK